MSRSRKPRSVCGKDERVEVDPKTSPPYKWICDLQIVDSTGSYQGSGFRIHLRNVEFMAIATAGHNIYENGYATRVTVKFPGQDEIVATSNDLYVPPEYISGDNNFDYGLIRLPGNSDEGFGWSTELSDKELTECDIAVCGYPGDKPDGTLWITGGPLTSHNQHHLYYMDDTFAGQSGSPVYTWHNGYETVIGIHVTGGCPNSARRFDIKMIHRFLERLNALDTKAINSVQWPNAYVRVVLEGEERPLPHGGGTVNCQYKPPGTNEKVYIYPPSIPPSLATQETTRKIVIESAARSNVFVRMEGNSMTKPEPSGGGVVNCQFGAGSYERYFLKEESGSNVYSIISAVNPKLRIRVVGSGVVQPTPPGGGTVNCQYYDSTTSPAMSAEKVKIVDVA